MKLSFGARAKVWGRLLRVSLTATAIADIVAGVVFGAAGVWPPGSGPLLWIVASLCVYHGSMALNDYADREHDARTRPERPIPSGAMGAGHALVLGLTLVAAGPLLAAAVLPSAGLWMGAVAALALLYTFVGRGPWRGPLLLGACRAGNLGLGLLFAAQLVPGAGEPAGPRTSAVLLALAYGLYVVLVSFLGRLEDREDGTVPTRAPVHYLRAMAAVLIAPAILALDSAPLARGAALVVGVLAARGLWRSSCADAWDPGSVMRAMGLALRRLLLFSAQVALLSWRPEVGWAGLAATAAILAGYPLAHALRRVFPPS